MKYKINDILDVTVTGIEPYGAFVRLEDGTKGLLHISEISYDYVVDINDYVKNNTLIKVKLIDIIDNEKVRVSLKALSEKGSRRKRYPYNKANDFKVGFTSLEKQLPEWIRKLEEYYEG